LIGGVIGLVVVLVMAFIGSRRKPEFDAPPKRNTTLTSSLAPADALARIKAIPNQQNKLALAAEQPAKGLVVLSDNMSLASFGNFYPVFAKAAGAGSEIVVGIQPKAPQYGPVVSNKLKKVTEAVRAAVA
jgi:hypothetical protein